MYPTLPKTASSFIGTKPSVYFFKSGTLPTTTRLIIPSQLYLDGDSSLMNLTNGKEVGILEYIPLNATAMTIKSRLVYFDKSSSSIRAPMKKP